MIFIAQCLVDCCDHYLLKGDPRHCSCIAEQAGVFQAADAPPNHRLFTPVIPVHPAEHLAAIAADNYLGKAVVTAEGPVLSVRAGVDDSAADKFFLNLHENFTRDDGFMAVFYIILQGHCS